jgi:hypothetical protein
MSLNKTAIDAYIDRRLGLKSPHNLIAYPLVDRTADENLALDYILAKIFQVGGRWQFDDSNHTDYPIIMTNLVAGQRDYSFTTDEQGNLILDIYKIMVSNDGGVSYDEVYPVDMRADDGTNNLWDNKDVQGTVFRYSKTANGIFLDQLPSANVTNGLKIFINREGSHFTTSDTTKMPGFAGSYHEYVGLRPAHRYATDHSMANADDLKVEMQEMEQMIMKHYRDRSKDENLVLQAEEINFI